MYEICALLRRPKQRRPRKTPIKAIRAGASVRVRGHEGIVTGRDAKFANAWFVRIDGAPTYSYSRDMIEVI